jgi:hypothetical protein
MYETRTNIKLQGPNNLAFGRAPVCILRIDFIILKLLLIIGITYEPLVWDLNPEGIGVTNDSCRYNI